MSLALKRAKVRNSTAGTCKFQSVANFANGWRAMFALKKRLDEVQNFLLSIRNSDGYHASTHNEMDVQ